MITGLMLGETDFKNGYSVKVLVKVISAQIKIRASPDAAILYHVLVFLGHPVLKRQYKIV